jgi:hypothetical protein
MTGFQIEQVEPGILLTQYQEMVTTTIFREATLARVKLADEFKLLHYVLVVDYSQTVVNNSTFNLRLNAWSVNLDSRMEYTIIISKQMLVRTAVNLLRNLVKIKLEFAKDREVALKRAREVYTNVTSPVG